MSVGTACGSLVRTVHYHFENLEVGQPTVYSQVRLPTSAGWPGYILVVKVSHSVLAG